MCRFGGDPRRIGGQLETGKRPFEVGDSLGDSIRALVRDACLPIQLVELPQPRAGRVMDG